jgi:putative membrane protein
MSGEEEKNTEASQKIKNQDDQNEEISREEIREKRMEMTEERTKAAEERTDAAEERTEMAEERTEWASDRTDWAEHRTVLANERTFSAWIRTGISSMAGGVAVVEFLGERGEQPIARILGVILIAIGGGVVLLSLWRFNKISDVLEAKGLQATPRWAAVLLAAALLLAAVLLLILVFRQ